MKNRRAGMMTAILEAEDGRLLVCTQTGDQYFLMDSSGATEKIDTAKAVRIYTANKGSNDENLIHSLVDDMEGDFGWKERLQKTLGNKAGSFLNKRKKAASNED